MKEKIHPNYMQAKIICACGRSYTTGSTKPELHVEVCAGCHPFYTGTQHILDIQGRVERFHQAVREESGRRTRLRGGRPAPLGADPPRPRMTEKKPQPALYGGQAVIEGVMIRGRRTVALACRKPNGDIYRYREPLRSPLVRSRIARLPFVRGVVVLWESLDYGIRMLMRSADVQLEHEEQLGKGGNTLIMGVALVGALLLFIGVPYLVHEPRAILARVGREGSGKEPSETRGRRSGRPCRDGSC